ncbi:MAG: thioredoxin [Bacteroidales bacterium]|nr:thioredoxin [Bacteroidales bacterium]
MRKCFLLALACLTLGIYGNAQTKATATKVKQLTYSEFLKNIWDFEKNPNTFVYKGKAAAIVDFYADWCGPCRKVAPIMEKLALEYDGKLVVYKVNVDQEKELASAFQIRSIPTVLFIPKDGQPMLQVGAMTEAQFRDVITKHLVK